MHNGNDNGMDMESILKNEEWMSPKEVSNMLGVSLSTVSGWVRSRKVLSYKIGGKVRIGKKSVLDLIEIRTVEDDDK